MTNEFPAVNTKIFVFTVCLHSLLGVGRADREGGVDIGVIDLVSIVDHHPQNASD